MGDFRAKLDNGDGWRRRISAGSTEVRLEADAGPVPDPQPPFERCVSGPITAEDRALESQAERDADAAPTMSENTRRALADVPKR